MDTEEEEPRQAPNVELSQRFDDNPVTTATTFELRLENTESQQCELESVSELDGSGQPAPSAVPPVTEKEKEGDGEGIGDVKVVLKAAVGDEEGGGDLVSGEEKREMSDAGDGIKASSAIDAIDGNTEGEGVADREDSLVAVEEKADLLEDTAVDCVMQEIEKADVSDERGTKEGMGVAVPELSVVELSEEAANLEKKVVDDVQDQIEKVEEKEVDDVAEERGISKIAELDDVTEQTEVMEETGLADVMEKTGIVKESEVEDVAVKRKMLEEKQVDNEVEQTGILEETGVVNMAEESELLEEKLVFDVAERTPTTVGTGVTDMAEKNEILDKEMVADMPEQTETLEDTNAVRDTGTDMAEVVKDTVMGEESNKAGDTETGNLVESVEKAEGTETEMGDVAEGMEAAEDTEMLDMTEDIETEAAEETEDTEEVEDANKASGGKRKRGKNLNSKVLARAPSRKKVEEDVCFICFDGGDLVLCDRRGCPKAYHTACVGRDEAFFRSKGKWNCGLVYLTVKLAGVGFCDGTGSSISSFACFSNWFNVYEKNI